MGPDGWNASSGAVGAMFEHQQPSAQPHMGAGGYGGSPSYGGHTNNINAGLTSHAPPPAGGADAWNTSPAYLPNGNGATSPDPWGAGAGGSGANGGAGPRGGDPWA